MDKRYIKKRILGYNERIKMAIKERRIKCSEWKKEKDETKKAILEESYKEQKGKVNNMMDIAEGDEIRKMINKNGEEQMDFWKMMRKIRNTKQQTNKIRKADGEITDDLMEIMREKKNYYEKLYSKQNQNPEEKINEVIKMEEIMAAMKRGKNLEMSKITVKEVENCIEKNGNNKAPDPDEITNKMLREGKELIKERLSEVMNGMKENNMEIPENWKVGEIISFYKGKGDYLDLSCQRGISLTSTVLKLLESIIKERIESEIRNKSTPQQGGGKKGESPEEYIFIIQTIIDSNRKEGKSSKLIITDVEKAFDQA